MRKQSNLKIDVSVSTDYDGFSSARVCVRSRSGRRGKSAMPRCGSSYDVQGPSNAVAEALRDLADQVETKR